MRLPRTGKDLYKRVQPPAEAIKGYIQIAIGICSNYCLCSALDQPLPCGKFNIVQEALRLVGYGLAASAAVESARVPSRRVLTKLWTRSSLALPGSQVWGCY